MKNLIYAVLLILFVSCSDATEDIKPDNNQDIVHYRFKTFLIQVDYSKELTGGTGLIAPAFTLIQAPKESTFHTNVKPYGPDLFFFAESITGITIFAVSSIYYKVDTIKDKGRGNEIRYLIKLEK